MAQKISIRIPMDQAEVYIVDQDKRSREGLAQFLAGLAVNVKTADSLEALLARRADDSLPAIVFLSLDLVPADGLAELRRLRKSQPRLSLILLCRSQKAEPAASLLQQGVIDHVASPDHPASVYAALRNEIAKRQLTEKNASYARQLRRLKLEQSENQRKASDLEEIYNATLENLMTALDLRDVETFGHSLTVAKYSQALAQLIGIKNGSAVDNIRKGALLHDIGKIAIPDSILKKPSRLSAAEWEKVKLHPVLGYGLIKEIKLVREIGNIILYHHERYDGKGYPKGLKAESIPLEARIFAVADALDAITSHRPYRKERDFRAARKGIQENRASQFDPRVVDAFSSVRLEEWERIRYETTKILPALENFSELYKK
jgi:putative nucleotidyltransferase with HDIG domain